MTFCERCGKPLYSICNKHNKPKPGCKECQILTCVCEDVVEDDPLIKKMIDLDKEDEIL